MTQAIESASSHARSPHWRKPMLPLLACAVLGVSWWWVHGSTDTLRRSTEAANAALVRMQADAAAIHALRQAPQRAVDQVRPSEELLSQVDRVLTAVEVPKSLWRDSVPMPPQRDADGGFVRYTTRLYFEGANLQQTARLIHALLDQDSILRVSALQLTAKGEGELWNLEAAISYRLYAPQM